MPKSKEKFKEIPVYTAERPEIAQMLVEKLAKSKIPARINSDSASAGAFAIPMGGRVILVPEKYAERAREVLEIS